MIDSRLYLITQTNGWHHSDYVHFHLWNAYVSEWPCVRSSAAGGLCELAPCCLPVSVTGASLSPSEAKTGWQRLEMTFLDACGKSSIIFHIRQPYTDRYHGDQGGNGLNRSVGSGTRRVFGLSPKCQECERVIDSETKWYKWKVLLIWNALNVRCVTCFFKCKQSHVDKLEHFIVSFCSSSSGANHKTFTQQIFLSKGN